MSRDLVPVVGWNDKAFRGLTTLLPQGSRVGATPTADVGYEYACHVVVVRRAWSRSRIRETPSPWRWYP